MRLRELSGRLGDWPRYAQAAGMILGTEQLLAWWLGGMQPNYGAMTFAAALLMITRVAPAQERRNAKHGGR
jgi:hypothetical protein